MTPEPVRTQLSDWWTLTQQQTRTFSGSGFTAYPGYEWHSGHYKLGEPSPCIGLWSICTTQPWTTCLSCRAPPRTFLRSAW